MSAATLPMPSAELAQARLAAAELSALIDRVGPDTVAGLILTHARRELASLTRGQAAAVGTATGPHRLKVAG